ncbi:DUF1996 domain-containing protein [Umezawaea tangerina]|uniref:DUF1996 domain-containing protein n=1 Tax=Umezawaea tangerina TaxID=84725 RepID=UPI001FEA007A|nr:DUF1996 domain-containing protein [Umezawaea tangerina]
MAVSVFRTVVLAVVALLAACTTADEGQFVGIEQVVVSSGAVAPGPDASTGSFRIDCGRNGERHLNADNAVISPGVRFGAHHTHEYVGNLSTDAFSTPESLAAAASTCADGDLSAYFWPVLRLTDVTGHDEHAEGGGVHGNTGEVLPPASVGVVFDGNPNSRVVPLPRFVRMITGNPSAATGGGLNANAKWGCSGFEGRTTMKYPRCPAGSKVVRTFDFPSCWDGRNVDSASHRDHVAFATADGVCPARTFPVPELHLVVTYDVPAGRPFAVDSFPDEHRDPMTDHAMFVNAFPVALMAQVTACLNEGRACG